MELWIWKATWQSESADSPTTAMVMSAPTLEWNKQKQLREREWAGLVMKSNLTPHVLSVTRSLICFRSLKSPVSTLNIDTGFLGLVSGLIMTLTNMNIKLFCATTQSDEPRILKGGFWCIKTLMYANVFQDLIWSFVLGYLKIYRHVLVSGATSNTKSRAERWRITLIIQWISILCLLSVTSVILGWSNMNAESRGQ